jgi:hypothetical protein
MLAALAAPATASPLDGASAHRALLALRSYLRANLHHRAAAQASADGFVQGITAACPNVLAALNLQPVDSLNKGALTAFAEEASADVGQASFPPLRPILARMDRKVRPLRWSHRGQARRIRGSLTDERRYLFTAPSDICANAQALAANNAQATPPGTLSFLASYGRAAKGAGFGALTTALSRFQRRSDHRLVSEVNRLNRRVVKAGRSLVQAEGTKLLRALGISA